MSGEAKDPAIKLFGKTIPLPDIPPPIIANSVDDKELVLPLNSWSLPEDKERKEEVNKDDDNEDDDDKEQLHRNGGSSDGSDATIETPPDNESDRRNHSKSNNLQDKTLKKPDKILPCPRCNSMDTKFCYYNNYNVNQPRHFCKNCQRYWTAGGTMRNVPVGAGRRNNKISSSNHYRQLTIPEQNADPNTGFPTNIPEPNWPYTWSPVPPPPGFCPPGVPIVTPFSPTPAYWVPLLPQSSSPNSSSGLNSPTLGKRSRDELTTTTVRPNGSEPVRNQISVPNTLKIYDPREAANCSIRTALSDSLGEGIFKGFQPKDYEKNHIFETDLILQANPAALSRSLKFHEAT